ncbi:MAG: ribonuclease H-like domain-containing protein [archaeon]
MLRSSFIILDGIGKKAEQNIWQQEIQHWPDFLSRAAIRGIGKERKTYYDRMLLQAMRAHAEAQYSFFAERLLASEQYRLYDELREHCLFVDIETSNALGDITVIGLSDGEHMKTLVKGINLFQDVVVEAFSQAELLLTFNGSSFDLPMLRKFCTLPDLPHIDLRHVAARLGYTGGLKAIEHRLGITRRESVQGMQGSDAAPYWHLFKLTGNRAYLERLIAYNEEDVLNLRTLADILIPKLWAQRHESDSVVRMAKFSNKTAGTIALELCSCRKSCTERGLKNFNKALMSEKLI